MWACSNSVRCRWLRWGLALGLCLLTTRGSAVPQTVNIPTATLPAGYRIAGTVVSKTDGRPLARARVTITDAKDSRKFEWIITAEDGKYDFHGLPAAGIGHDRILVACLIDQDGFGGLGK